MDENIEHICSENMNDLSDINEQSDLSNLSDLIIPNKNENESCINYVVCEWIEELSNEWSAKGKSSMDDNIKT